LESGYRSENRIPPHEHSAAFFDLVLAGCCAEVVDGQARERSRLTLAFHPAGEVHSSRWHGQQPRCFHIEIPPAVLGHVRQYAPILDQAVHFTAGLPLLLAARLYREFERRDEVSPLVIEGLTLELLAETARLPCSRPERKAPPWLSAVRNLLHARFAERLTLQAVAASVGIHPAHLARVFRQFHRCTLGEFVRKVRIEYVCKRLTTSDVPLAEIALEAGFSDQSHFSNTFKRWMGVSPMVFRKYSAARKWDATGCSDRTRS
jgi:AraC family transcriptional regulator